MSLTHGLHKQNYEQILWQKARGQGVKNRGHPTTSAGSVPTYSILLTAYEQRKLRLWNGWLPHGGRRAGSEWDSGISAGVGPCLTEAHLRTRPQEHRWWASGPAGFTEWKEKHLSFQREEDQERQEHIAFCKKKKSAFAAYVYTNIYFQGCSESNIIREKNKTRFKGRVRNMLNYPPNGNQAAPGGNKIFIISLSPQRSVITLPINSW